MVSRKEENQKKKVDRFFHLNFSSGAVHSAKLKFLIRLHHFEKTAALLEKNPKIFLDAGNYSVFDGDFRLQGQEACSTSRV